MKLYQYNATAVLFEKANAISEMPDSWRAIHLPLAGMQQRYNRTLRTNFILRNIMTAVAGEDGYVYLCGDGDIVILFQGRLKPMLRKLAAYFGDIDPAAVIQEARDTFLVFDLSKDWAAFHKLCFAKSMNEAYDRLLMPENLPASHYAAAEAPAP